MAVRSEPTKRGRPLRPKSGLPPDASAMPGAILTGSNRLCVQSLSDCGSQMGASMRGHWAIVGDIRQCQATAAPACMHIRKYRRDGGFDPRPPALKSAAPGRRTCLMSPGGRSPGTTPGVAWCLCTLATLAPAPRAAESRISACRAERRIPGQASVIFGSPVRRSQDLPMPRHGSSCRSSRVPADRAVGGRSAWVRMCR